MKKRRLRARTTAVLIALAEVPGGADAAQLGRACAMSARSTARRLVALKRAGLAQYVKKGARWELAVRAPSPTGPSTADFFETEHAESA